MGPYFCCSAISIYYRKKTSAHWFPFTSTFGVSASGGLRPVASVAMPARRLLLVMAGTATVLVRHRHDPIDQCAPRHSGFDIRQSAPQVRDRPATIAETGRSTFASASTRARRAAPRSPAIGLARRGCLSTVHPLIDRRLPIAGGGPPQRMSSKLHACAHIPKASPPWPRTAASGCNGTKIWAAIKVNGGEGGIRTHGTREGTPHFECGTFDHSATSPRGR